MAIRNGCTHLKNCMQFWSLQLVKAVVEFEKVQRMPAKVIEFEMELGWRSSQIKN